MQLVILLPAAQKLANIGTDDSRHTAKMTQRKAVAHERLCVLMYPCRHNGVVHSNEQRCTEHKHNAVNMEEIDHNPSNEC